MIDPAPAESEHEYDSEKRENSMEARISSIVLGVEDLQRATGFYKDGLGFPLGHHTESIAFIELTNVQLILFSKQSLAQEAQVGFSESGIPPVSLVHHVESEAEVREVVNRALAAGAQLTRPPSKTCYEGVTAYFADPEGYLWEVVWDPNLHTF